MKKKIEKDYREGQRVVLTLEIEDKGQDFLELDILQNGVILGNSVIFSHGRMSLLGIGAENGAVYYTSTEVIEARIGALKLEGFIVYLKDTGEKDPIPWEANTLKYKVVGAKKAAKQNRFIKK